MNMSKDMILKMKKWMFELTGDWNVFLFEGEGLIEAYKATIEAYERTTAIVPSPPFNLEKILAIK